jgi:PAS domain S-box-containing protein
MIILMVITGLALWNITSLFSLTTRELGHASREVQAMWSIDREVGRLSMYVHDFVASGDRSYQRRFETSRAAVRRMLNDLSSLNLSTTDMKLLASVISDFGVLEQKAGRAFSLRDPLGADRVLAYNLMIELDGLTEWMSRDMERYRQDNGARMTDLVGQINGLKVRTDVFLVIIFISAVAFLSAFGWYLYRTVTVPIAELWDGTAAISRGDLDLRITTSGGGTIAKLAERFNDMARKLRQSYAVLEQRLFDRTRELTAINSLALALGKSGSLRDMLQDTLLRIVDSLSHLEPKGGIFLCDPDGTHLRLMTQTGMSREFEDREAVIPMGECLCGAVAQTGELLYTGASCDDPRHTRETASGGHSHIIIPIKSRGKVFGVIFLYPGKEFTLNPSDIQFFDAVGSQLGIAVENASLYRAVQASGEKYWDLFENSLDLLCTVDAGGRLTAVNRSMAEFLGRPKDGLIGRPAADFLSEDGAAAVRAALAGGQEALMRFESEVVKKDGSRAVIEVSIRRVQKSEQPDGFQLSARDVTEQKQLREKLVQAERLAAIGQVGIAFRHEINNPLTTVVGNAELLLDRYETSGDAELLKRLHLVVDNALRIAEIVNRLKQIKVEKTVDYIDGVKMTDLKQG